MRASVTSLDHTAFMVSFPLSTKAPIGRGDAVCCGLVAEIITQIQRPTPFVRKAEVTEQPGQLSQSGQERPIVCC